MKKLMLISALFVTQAAVANPDKYLPEITLDSPAGIKLRNFVREVMKIEKESPGLTHKLTVAHKLMMMSPFKAKEISKTYNVSMQQVTEYYEKKTPALSVENLNNCSPHSKFEIIKSIFQFVKTEKIDSCEPVHIAQSVVDSFSTISNKEPKAVLNYMLYVNKYIRPMASNLELEGWAKFAIQQARNTNLPKETRIAFAEAYPKFSKSQDKNDFSVRLLSEIGY